MFRVLFASFGKRFIASRLIALVGTASLAACAQLPDQSGVQSFGQAASSISTLFGNSISLNANLAQRSSENEAVAKFLDTSPQAPIPCCQPQTQGAALSSGALQPRRDLIDAIAKYAGALATASDPKTFQALQTSATTLASTVGGDVAALIGPEASPLVTPVGQFIGTAFGLAITSEQAAQIRDVMRKTQPVLAAAAAELKRSMAIIRRNNQTQLTKWQASEIEVLAKLRGDARVGNNILEAEFRGAVSDAKTLQASIAAMDSYSQVLDAMVKAHASLIDPGPDTSMYLANFLALVAKLQGIISVIKQ